MSRWAIGWAALLLAWMGGALAAPLQVGVRETPPFAMRGEDGSWSGISVELWERMATRLELDYVFVAQPRLEPMFAALASGQIDAAIGALTVTGPREIAVDFTHPFFNAGLAIATPRSTPSLWQSAKALMSPGFWSALAALGLLLLVVGFLIWLFERRHNPQFPPQPGAGIGDGFWWSAVTMTTVGYGDKAPVSFAGRSLAVIWMFVGIITISSFTAAITSSLTQQALEGHIRDFDDLHRLRVVTVADSTAAQLLDSRGLNYQAEPDVEVALNRLVAGEADALVYDTPVLRHLLHVRSLSQMQLLPQARPEAAYAIALTSGSALREPLNRELLGIRAGAGWEPLLMRYLGQ